MAQKCPDCGLEAAQKRWNDLIEWVTRQDDALDYNDSSHKNGRKDAFGQVRAWADLVRYIGAALPEDGPVSSPTKDPTDWRQKPLTAGMLVDCLREALLVPSIDGPAFTLALTLADRLERQCPCGVCHDCGQPLTEPHGWSCPSRGVNKPQP